ncbi:MAG: carbamoyl phosphate synthase-like protein [Betaproteobacteria bacterium ADurb.Bin341]|nr:MAG: carbamoyl phosphate synthase-like protein [Betaproteobacteria bacterium ADurb.Bin341]
MTRILITAIGGDIAQAAASIIRQSLPDWSIVGVDMDTRHGGSLFVDQFSVAPSALSDGYLDWLKKFIAEQRIDYCLPMSEAELSVFAELDSDHVAGARLLWAGKLPVKIGCDKLKTADFIRAAGIPAPWTLAATEDAVPPEFPCLFKLRCSAGSKAVFVCKSLDEVYFFRKRYPEAVLQEYLPGDDKEVTCAVYRSASGEIEVLQMLRRLVGGFTGWARVIDEPEITAQCRRLVEALDLRGAINVQLRMTAAGPRIFEINPRFSSTLLMRHLAGFSDLLWLLDEVQGRPVRLQRPVAGTLLARTQGAVVLATPSKENGNEH